MANPSIFAAFERMWQHVVTALSGKSDSNHTHDDRYYTEVEVDTKISNHTDNSDVHVTTTNKTQWNSAYTHSTSPHAPSTAEKNIIVGIQKNGTDLTVNSSTRKVNITVPTQASDIEAAPASHGHDTATTNNDGFMTAAMVTKLSGIATGAQVNTITGVKGNSESSYRTGNVNITKANIGLGNVDNTSDANKPVSTAQQTAIDASLNSAKSYTNEKIDAIVGEGASTTLDTIGEISAAITENQGMLTTLNNAIGNKVDKVSGKGLSTNDLTAALKSNYDTAYSHVSNTNNPHEVTLSQLGVSATATELNYVDGVTSNIQTQLNGKQASITGGASTIASSNLTASRALVSNSSGKVAVSAITSTELGYLDGVTSNIQTQLDAKSASGHTHNYAGSSSVGGAATSANKVNSSLTVKLNGGNTEGANMFTFNGSSAKSVNITPSAIGASASGHTHDDRYYTESEIDSLLSEKSDSEHGHIISDVSGLQSALDGKANTSHGTHVSYSTTAPVMNGTASVGSATTVARSDHKHPTDTSRASKTEFDAHTSDTTAHMTSTQKSQLTAAYNHSTSAHAPSSAQANVIESIKVNGTAQTITSKAVNITVPTNASDIGAAESSHNHDTSNITSGTLSSDRLPTVPITKGGTDATTAADAIVNLGAMDLASDQSVSGVKTFTNGINIGNAMMTYDETNKRLVISVQ